MATVPRKASEMTKGDSRGMDPALRCQVNSVCSHPVRAWESGQVMRADKWETWKRGESVSQINISEQQKRGKVHDNFKMGSGRDKSGP